jgi:hypothetical protein
VPTFERGSRFDREFRRLSREMQRAFLGLEVLPLFIAALRATPPDFPPQLRVKRVEGSPGVWEMSFAADGRATFEYGAERIPGSPHVVWRRIGRHEILREP